MGAKLQTTVVFLFLYLTSGAAAQRNAVVSVTTSQALLAAFKKACEATGPSKIVIPKGEHFMDQVTLQGPCKGPIEIVVHGTVTASQHPAVFKGRDSWFTFNNINLFTLSGSGTFDGKGKSAWAINDCHKNTNCARLPISLRFNFITNAIVRDVTSLDSKNFHVNVIGCQNLTFTNVKIQAPAESPNTDGIHLGRSNGVNIVNSVLATGDDCISIGDGMRNLNVTNVWCGPGHGISVGSLGKYRSEEPVDGITIRNCTFRNTGNGVRIKTWPSTPVAITVSNIIFDDIMVNNVSNPIIIDQEYCPSKQCKFDYPSKVKISNVRYNKIRGTSFTKEAVTLKCSKGVPCENVEFGYIGIRYRGPRGPATFQCSNVKPKLTGTQTPKACSRMNTILKTI